MTISNKVLVLTVMVFASCTQLTSQTAENAAQELPLAQSERQLVRQDQTPEQRQNSQAINDYFDSLNKWDEVSHPLNDGEKVKKTTSRKVVSPEGVQNCTVEEVTLTKNPSKIVIQNPAAELLYPGALIQGEGYAQAAGGVREVPIRKRAPIMIATDLVNENSTITVENLNYGTYKEAYTKLVRDAIAQATPARSNMYYDYREVKSAEEGALNLGFSARFLGQSLKGDIHKSDSVKENTVMAFFEHRAFTISALSPTSPAGLFSDDFSVDELKAQKSIGVKNPPLFVSNVNYGRILMFTVTSKHSVDEIKGALTAVFNKVSAEGDLQIDGNYKKVMNEATVRVLTLGGDKERIEGLIKSGNLKEYFGSTPSLDSYEPISYTFRNVIDGSIAKVAESTDFSRVECAAGGPAKAWRVRISIDSITAKHGVTNYRTAPVFGQIKLNGKLLWDHPTAVDYVILTKDIETAFDAGQNTIEVDLPVDHVRKTTLSVNLRENWMPFFSRFLWPANHANYQWVKFEQDIGYNGSGQILADGKYTITNQNADIKYSIKKIGPIYEDAGGSW